MNRSGKIILICSLFVIIAVGWLYSPHVPYVRESITPSKIEEWNMFMKTPSHTFLISNGEIPVSLVASRLTSKLTFTKFFGNGMLYIDNMLLNKDLLIISQDEMIKAYSPTDLQSKWTYRIWGYPFTAIGSLAQKNNLLFIGAWSPDKREGLLRAIDVRDQATVWEHRFSRFDNFNGDGPPGFGLTIAQDKLVVTLNGVRESGSNLYVLNTSNGDVIWERKIKGNFSNLNTISIPTVDKNELFVASAIGSDFQRTEHSYLHKLKMDDGKTLWEKKMKNTFAGYPIVHKGRVFFGIDNTPGDNNLNSDIYCINSVDGSVYWQTQATMLQQLTLHDGKLFAGCYGNLIALNAETGKILWNTKLDFNNPVFFYPVIPYGRYIAADIGDQYLRIIDSSTGKVMQSIKLDNADATMDNLDIILVSGNYLYCAYSNGEIAVFNKKQVENS